MKYFLRFSLTIFILIVYQFLNLFAFKLNINTTATNKLPSQTQIDVNTMNSFNNENTFESTFSFNDSNFTFYSNLTKIGDGDAWNLISSILLSLVLIPIILATLIGNLLVIFAVVIVRKLHTQDNANNFLIVSLAVSDLLVGVLVMPFGYYVNISKDNKWYLGAILCDLWTLSDVLLCTASILNLVAISVDRYFIILHAMVYTQKRNAKLMLLMILVVWCVSAIISIPPLFGWGKPSSRLEIYQTCEVSTDLNYQIYATLFSFYIPLIAMIIIYIAIYRAALHIKKREMETSCRTQYNQNLPYSPDSMGNIKSQVEPLLNQNNNFNFTNKHSTFSESSSVKKTSSSTNNNSNNFLLKNNKNSRNLKNILNIIVNPFDKRDSKSKKNKQKNQSTKNKKSTSESEQGSIESKLYNSSESSHENISSINNKETNRALLNPVSTMVLSPLNSNNSGSHVTINANGQGSRRGSFGRKFGRRLTQAFSGFKRNSAMSSSHGKNQKATRTLGVIMGCFLLCWLPFFILALLKPIPVGNGLSVGHYIPKWLDSFLLWLGYFNSALNPMIYARFNREFRKPFIEILCFRCRGINDKLRDEERRKMYDYASQGHSSISHAHLSPNNLYSLPSASNSHFPSSTEIKVEKVEVEPEKEKTIEKEEQQVPKVEVDSSVNISVCKEQIEKEKNRFFYGTDYPPEGADKTMIKIPDIDVNNNEAFEESNHKKEVHRPSEDTIKTPDKNLESHSLEETLSLNSVQFVSPHGSPRKDVEDLTENSYESDIVLEQLKDVKYRKEHKNKINNSSTRSSIITNDSSNYYESTNSILQPLEDSGSILSSSYLKSMDSTSLHSKQSSSLASKQIASNNLNQSRHVISKADSIDNSIPSSSVYSFYSTAPTSPVNILLASIENTTISDSCSNDTNQICDINSSKSDTSRQRKLLNNSNSSGSNYNKNTNNQKQLPLAYCTYSKQHRSSGSKNSNSKILIKPSIPDALPISQIENDFDENVIEKNHVKSKVTSSV